MNDANQPSPERTIIDAARKCRAAQKHFYAQRRAAQRWQAVDSGAVVNEALDDARAAERELDRLLASYDDPQLAFEF